MRGLRLSLLLLAPCLPGLEDLPAEAKTNPGSSVATEAAFVPRFAPPLSQPLLYRLTKERITPSTNERSVLDQQVVFKRDGPGFVMQITWLRVTVGERTYDLVKDLEQFPAEARAVFLPIAIELDRNGRPLRVRDWPRLRTMLIELSPLVARGLESDQAKRKTAETFLRGFMQRYAALSAEEAVNHLVQGWPPILAELGGEVTLGREDHSTMQAPTPFSAEPIDYDTTATWTLIENGRTLHLARRSIPSDEGLRAVGSGMAEVARQVRPASKSLKPDKLQRVFSGMKLTIQTDIDFDRTNGLLRKAVVEKTVLAQAMTGRERMTIEAR